MRARKQTIKERCTRFVGVVQFIMQYLYRGKRLAPIARFSSLLILMVALFQSCQHNYSLPSSLQLNGRIESIIESSYGVKYKFGDPCQSELKTIAMHFGMPCESRKIIFDDKGNIIRIEADNSIVQQATYSSSNVILEELMTDDEGLLDYRVYSDIQSNLPLGNKMSNYYQFKPIFPKENPLFQEILFDSIIEQNLLDEPCSFIDTLVLIKKKNYDGYFELQNAIAFNKDGEYYYHFKSVPGRAYYRKYIIESSYEDGKPKMISFGRFKIRLDYDNSGNIIKERTYDKSGDLLSVTEYSFNIEDNCLKKRYIVFSEDIYEHSKTDNETIYYFSPTNKVVLEETRDLKKIRGVSSSRYSYNDKNQIITIDDYHIKRDNNLVRTISRDSWAGTDEYLYEYLDFSGAFISNLCDTDFSEYTKVDTEYDEFNNWIKKICYINEEIVTYYTRTIIYK